MQQQRLIDIEGQVDRFYRKLQARQSFVEQQQAKEDAKTSPTRPVAELELGTRPTDALAKAGITNVGQVIDKLVEGDAALLGIEGFGRKSLIDIKKKLRALGMSSPNKWQKQPLRKHKVSLRTRRIVVLFLFLN